MSSLVAAAVALALAVEPPIAGDAPAPEDEPVSEPSADPPAEPSAPVEAPAEPAPAPPQRSTGDDAAARASLVGGVGGYDDAFDLKGRPPPDGEDEVLAGSIVLPLGIIGAASSGVQLWLSMPGYCQDRWDSIGSRPTEDQCKGVYVFSIIRVVHSSLMATAGAVLLGIGLVRRKKLKAWKRGGGSSAWRTDRISASPWVARTGAGLGLSLRF